jgi:hypothetical protein
VITTVFSAEVKRYGGAHHYPASVVVDAAGNLLIADPFQQRVITIGGLAAPTVR